MDPLQGLWVQAYTVEQITEAFKTNPSLLTGKRAQELQIASIFATVLQQSGHPGFIVGFPLKSRPPDLDQGTNAAENIRRLLNSDLLRDEDIDVCISDRDNAQESLYRLQIARLIDILKHRKQTTQDVILILKRKFRIQPDPRVYLIVYVEEDATIELDEVSDFIKSNEIPYGMIFILGENAILRKRVLWEVYPQHVQYKARL
jgi:hypothetical protein